MLTDFIFEYCEKGLIQRVYIQAYNYNEAVKVLKNDYIVNDFYFIAI